jgi:YVTN family beta-propeller protein
MRLTARLFAATLVSCLIAASSAVAAGPLQSGALTSPHYHSSGAPYAGGGFDWFGPLSSSFGSLGTALVGSAPTGDGPSQLAVDSATHTIYVVNGKNFNGPISDGGDTVSVIDSRHCQAQDVSLCRGPWPTITVGDLPGAVAVDQATDTVYVANVLDNSVSVFNGARCNALNTSGCGLTPKTVPVGDSPLAFLVDDADHTVYVANEGDTTLSMINSATCDASHLVSCPTAIDPPPTVNVGNPPTTIDMDDATHTVYVGTYASTTVFDAHTCNATYQWGCATQGTLPGDGYSGPSGLEIDQANNTMYTANYDNSISAFDLSQCNASNLPNCSSQVPGTVLPFPYSTFDNAIWLTLDAPLHSVYVVYQQDGALFVVNTNVCNGGHLSACATLKPPAISTGDDPLGVGVDLQTQTLYVGNYADNTVSVIDATRCDATTTIGCRVEPPVVPISAAGLASDPTVNTVYATTQSGVSMINTRTCNSNAVSGCATVPPQFSAGVGPTAAAVDPLTHTAYIANYGTATTPGSVSVIDVDRCNATNPAGCGSIQTLQVPGGNPDDIEVNAATDTVYVATTTASGPNLLSVFNGATCDATNASECDQVPATLALGDSCGQAGDSGLIVAVNPATNTVYATNIACFLGEFTGTSVYVINGASCDAADPTCSQPPAIITPGNPLSPGGLVPWGIAVDQATDTIYVTIQANGDYAATVAVIDGATCNGSDMNGCGQTPPTVAAGYGASELAIDPQTHNVYTTNTEDASLSVIPGAICNRFTTIGCSAVPPKVAAGDYPGYMPGTIAVDPAAATVYVVSFEGVSVVALAP